MPPTLRPERPLGATGVTVPLIEVCSALFGEAVALQRGGADMIAVLSALEARTAAGATLSA